MKISKTAATILAFALGATVFITTAFADVALGSGYDRLKDSMKRTTSQLTKNQKSFTFESSAVVKDNGKMLHQSSGFSKLNFEKNEFESSMVYKYESGKTTNHFNYEDSSIRIWKNEMDPEEKYYVTEFPSGNNKPLKNKFPNPFEQNGAEEAEKLFDAVVGNLKNYIQVEDRQEGGKKYTGSIAQEQVPAIANAVSSYFFKTYVMDSMSHSEGLKFPQLDKDIHISKVSASAYENSSGILESIRMEVVLEGIDKNGAGHELYLDAAMKITDIDNTVVTKPDISGKKTEKVTAYGMYDSRYIGKYSNNIVIEKDGKLQKAGERILEIVHVDDKSIAGRYYEKVKPGFEEYTSKYEFSFDCNIQDNNEYGHRNTFSYTNPEGKKELGMLHMGMNGTIHLNLNVEIINEHSTRSSGIKIGSNGINSYFDGDLHKVFED